MSLYLTFPEKNKVNCWLLMATTLLKKVPCLKEVCICLYIYCLCFLNEQSTDILEEQVLE